MLAELAAFTDDDTNLTRLYLSPAHRAAAGFMHLRPQRADSLLERTAVAVLAVGLAVALEAPTLVEVEQGTSKLFRLQRRFQSLSAQLKRIQLLQSLACRLFMWKEPIPLQRCQHAGPALKQPVTPPPHGTCGPAGDGEGRSILGVAAIAEDACAGFDDG